MGRVNEEAAAIKDWCKALWLQGMRPQRIVELAQQEKKVALKGSTLRNWARREGWSFISAESGVVLRRPSNDELVAALNEASLRLQAGLSRLIALAVEALQTMRITRRMAPRDIQSYTQAIERLSAAAARVHRWEADRPLQTPIRAELLSRMLTREIPAVEAQMANCEKALASSDNHGDGDGENAAETNRV